MAPASAEPPKFTWLSCGNFQSTGIGVISTHLNLATFVTEERTWKKALCYTTTDSRLFFSILPGKTIASKSQKLKRMTALLLLDGS